MKACLKFDYFQFKFNSDFIIFFFIAWEDVQLKKAVHYMARHMSVSQGTKHMLTAWRARAAFG